LTDDMSATVPRLRSRWLTKLLKNQWFGLLSLLVSLATLYLTFFWKPDDLVVYFRFAEPNEIGNNQLHLNYIFSNAGRTPVFIEDIGLTEVFYERMIIIIRQSIISIFAKLRHCTLQGMFRCFQEIFKLSQLILRKDGIVSFIAQIQYYVANSQSPSSSININAGERRAISTVYKMDTIDWDKFNNVVLCPVVRLFSSSGHPSTAICNGFEVDKSSDEKDGQKGTRAILYGLARLLPTSQSDCRIDAF
jgi:hypothetical protein